MRRRTSRSTDQIRRALRGCGSATTSALPGPSASRARFDFFSSASMKALHHYFLVTILGLGLAVAGTMAAGAAEPGDPLAPWRADRGVHPVAAPSARHTIHTYYLTRPESPDGARVLFYASTTPDGQHGDLIVLDRTSGKETVIARDLDTEDAHRAACQQWISNGKRVAYHD